MIVKQLGLWSAGIVDRHFELHLQGGLWQQEETFGQ